MENISRRTILILYALAMTFFIFGGETESDPEGLIWGVFFVLFATIPIAILCLRRSFVFIHGTSALVIGGAGLWGFWHTLHIAPPDGQSAIVFFVVPLYQFLAVALLTICLGVVSRFRLF